MSIHHDHGDNEKKKAAHPKVERDERYWLSLEQWGSDPEFQKLAEQEFISSPLKEEEGKEGGWARREFLKLMGASLALGSAGCMRRPVQKIVPYIKQPEEITLGKANYYTSSWFDGSEAFGLLVKTREGRPIKVEGNPLHPLNKNALSARGQAQLLSMYDPDRLTAPAKNILRGDRGNAETIATKWEDLDKDILEQLKKGDVYILTGHLASPSTRKLVKEFTEAFKAKHVMWEPLAPEEVRKGQQASYGAEIVPNYRFDQAKTIVSIDADFLGTWLMPTSFNRQFADGRRNVVDMSELVVFDSNYSLTGANADKRFKIKPSQQLDVAMGLLYEIVVKKGHSSLAANSEFKNTLSAYANTSEKLGFKDAAALTKVAESLLKNKGKSIVVAGGIASSDAVALQVAVNTLNSILENDGVTVDYSHPLVGLESSTADMLNLMAMMGEKKVKTLIVHGTNPSYYLGEDFNKVLAQVEMVISTADRQDETGKRANYVLPDLHMVENWGDVEVLSGVVSIQQPTIRPLYDSRAFQMSLITWAKAAGIASFQAYETYYDYVRNFWKENYFKTAKGTFEEFWYDILQKGVWTSWTEVSKLAVRSPKIDLLLKVKPVVKNGFELVVYPTVHLGKGDLANVSWLQEMPDVMTKIVWDNYISLSVASAETMKLHEGYLIDVEVNGVKARLPVHIQPGLHDEVAAIALGYGRTAAGKLGNGVGYNSYQLVSFKEQMPIYSSQMVKIDVAGGKYPLACVQGHHSMEGRSIVNEATLNEYLENKAAGLHKHHVFSIWPHHKYDGHKWGMSVDLNTCTGCSACVVACQAENNVPIVGKDYCIQGREMQWLRIDRYYTGSPADAEVVFQPIMCQHCDNAPCETVCPVLATVHSDEGLNEMVYNRCVGTRYCVNNCPYKVRRFNWFNFRKNMSESEKMALNPDVTVRVRGVMEKCTFCVQRIKAGKDVAKQEGRKLKDGEIMSACQQSCPTGAIVFGDLNDPTSAVAKAFNSEPRGYALLEEFNAAPSVRYLTKIRNNNEKTIATKNIHHADAKKGEH